MATTTRKNTGSRTSPAKASDSLHRLFQRVVVMLFDAPTGKKNEAVGKALDAISVAMKVDRCHFALINPEFKHLIWAGEGVNSGIEPNNAPYGRFDPKSYAWLLDTLSENEYLSIENIETELPEEALAIKETFIEYGYFSSLFVPLKKSGDLIGWIGFGKKKGRINWLNEDLQTIQAICTYLFTAITRFKSFKTIKSNAAILEEAERMAQMGSWELDLTSKRVRASLMFKKLLNFEDKDSQTHFRFTRIIKALGYENWTSLKEHFENLWQSGAEESIHLLIIDGKNQYFRILSKLVKSSKGIPYKFTGIIENITKQKNAEERLRESEARWRTLYETASDAIVIVENDVFVECNGAALDIYGCSGKEQIIGKAPWIFSPEKQPDGRFSKEKAREYIQQATQGKKPHFSWIHRRADGTLFEAEVSLSAIPIQGRLVVQGIVRDVTEKMQMIRAIKESEEKYRSLVESSLQGILILVNDKVRYINNTFVNLTGYSPEELYKMNRDSLVALAHPQDRDELREFNEYEITAPHIFEFRMRKKGGSYRWVRLRVGKMPVAEHNAVVVTAIDITERKKAHELALLSATESEDRERQRIAAELHDGLGQLLSSAVLNLGAIKDAVKKLDEKAVVNYQTALDTIKSALDETRMISHNLMPKAIKDFGYALAVEQLINSLKNTSGVQLSFFTNFRDGRFSPMLERNLYRITQEALTNIIKHAQAQSGVVQLMKYSDMIILTIEDDGIGFDLSGIDDKNHIGLRNIAIRAETIGAKLDIDSKPGHGTIIALQIPLIHE